MVGCPKPLPLPVGPKVVSNKEEEDDDINPFSGIISDGEEKTEEGDEESERLDALISGMVSPWQVRLNLQSLTMKYAHTDLYCCIIVWMHF